MFAIKRYSFLDGSVVVLEKVLNILLLCNSFTFYKFHVIPSLVQFQCKDGPFVADVSGSYTVIDTDSPWDNVKSPLYCTH